MNTKKTLYAVGHIRRMRGGSQAHLIRASDTHLYVTKFQNNPQHTRILANEYLASTLGRLLGLPIPEARIIDVAQSLIQETPELCVETARFSVPAANGLQFASRFVADPFQQQIFDYLPVSMFEKVINQQDFAAVLAFDKWAGNCDGRQVLFVKERGGHLYRAVFIDQGYCFNAENWGFPGLPLHGVYYRNHFYSSVTGWQSFEPVLSRIESISLADISIVAAEIPAEWYQHDSQGLSRLVETLYARRCLVRDLVAAFRRDSRNPFPNWVLDK